MKKLLMLLVLASVTACATLEHQQSYRQVAPTKYPQTAKVMVFEYRNVNIREIYELLYSDYLVVGRSEFSGAYENPARSVEFAKSIGAEIFIAASQFKDTQVSFVQSITPYSDTTFISGYTGTGSFYGTATSYGTRTTMIPVHIDRYDQSGLYLRNVDHVLPLWKRKIADYKETGAAPLSGTWYNENYELKLYKSGTQMVAFFRQSPGNRDAGQPDEIKMLFNPDTGVGIYLMMDRTPQPARIGLNKFGFLEVDLVSQNDTYSFARR
ncbi:MAG: hypothetical protein HZB47_08360 [Nitrosomonadales bacterium]|nr:hypothetical protein [Nitrosomonadales bacterium]